MPDLTVRDLLPTKFKRMDEVVEDELRRDGALRAARYPNGLNVVVADRATNAVAEVLDIDVFEILAGAWAKARELHEYSTSVGKHSSEETATLFLGEHELSADLHPKVELTFGSVSHVSLAFTLRLTATLRAARLVIRDGCIIEIGRCDGSVSAQLKYGDIPLHDKLKSKDLPLIPGGPLPPPGVRIP
jgi:hypothetical protein